MIADIAGMIGEPGSERTDFTSIAEIFDLFPGTGSPDSILRKIAPKRAGSGNSNEPVSVTDFLGQVHPVFTWKQCPYCESTDFKKNGTLARVFDPRREEDGFIDLQRLTCHRCRSNFYEFIPTLFEDGRHYPQVVYTLSYILYRENGLSSNRTAALIRDITKFPLSARMIRERFEESTDRVVFETKRESPVPVLLVDEQFITVCGRRYFRFTAFDVLHRVPVLEMIFPAADPGPSEAPETAGHRRKGRAVGGPTADMFSAFFERLSRLADVILFITDRNGGHDTVIRQFYPNARHQLCLFHVAKNLARPLFEAVKKKNVSCNGTVPLCVLQQNHRRPLS